MNRCVCVAYTRHFISPSYKNCGCYGCRNSQNVAPVVAHVYVAGNTYACFFYIIFCFIAVIPVVEVNAAKSTCPGNAGVGVLNFSLRLWDILSASGTYGGFHILS